MLAFKKHQQMPEAAVVVCLGFNIPWGDSTRVISLCPIQHHLCVMPPWSCLQVDDYLDAWLHLFPEAIFVVADDGWNCNRAYNEALVAKRCRTMVWKWPKQEWACYHWAADKFHYSVKVSRARLLFESLCLVLACLCRESPL